MKKTQTLFGLRRLYYFGIGLILLAISYYLDGSWQTWFYNREWFSESILNFDIIKYEIAPNFYYVPLDLSILLMIIGVSMIFLSILFWDFTLDGNKN